MREPKQAREKLRKAIEEAFLRIKDANDGRLGKAAEEIGVDRQQLQQWAKGVPAPADALLMAFMKWGVTIELHDEKAKPGEPRFWKFSVSGRDAGPNKPIAKPVQLSLFDALQKLEDSDVDVKIRSKTAGRLELGVEIGFKRVKF